MFIANCNKSASSSPTSTFQTHIQQTAFATLSLGTSNSIYPKLNFTFPILLPPNLLFLLYFSHHCVLDFKYHHLLNQASNHPKHPSQFFLSLVPDSQSNPDHFTCEIFVLSSLNLILCTPQICLFLPINSLQNKD